MPVSQNTNGTNGRDTKSGRFLSGNNGGPGRQKGSRNKLAEQFISDVYELWQRSGISALERVVKDEPATFVKVVANILPRQLDATLTVEHELLVTEARDFAAAFRMAQRMIGGELEYSPVIETEPETVEPEPEDDDPEA